VRESRTYAAQNELIMHARQVRKNGIVKEKKPGENEGGYSHSGIRIVPLKGGNHPLRDFCQEAECSEEAPALKDIKNQKEVRGYKWRNKCSMASPRDSRKERATR